MTDIGSSFNTRTMSDASLGSPGDRDLGLTIFSGKVLEAFYDNSVFYDNTGGFMAKKVLDGGISAQWPIIGEDFDLHSIGTFTDAAGAGEGGGSPDGDVLDAGDTSTGSGGLHGGYHEVGKFISGQQVKMSQKTITVDRHLVAAIDVPFLDLELTHFDVLAPYARKLGRILARDLDRKIATVALKTAQDTTGVTGVYPGGQLQHFVPASPANKDTVIECFPDTDAGATAFRTEVEALALKFDEDNVPEEGRYLFVTPYIRHMLVKLGVRANSTTGFRDPFDRETAGSYVGDASQRVLAKLAGFNVVVSNNLPGDWGLTTTLKRYESILGANGAKYDFNVAGTSQATGVPAAIALCGNAEGSPPVGMVQVGGVRTIIEDDERRNQKFMKSQILVGVDGLCPWTAGAVTCGSA